MQSFLQYEDHVDNQVMFRHLLQAMANPAHIRDIKFKGKAFDWFLCLGSCLLDNEVSFSVYGRQAYPKKLAEYTLAKNTDLEYADFVFVTNICRKKSIYHILNNCKAGSLSGPEKSATLIIFCADIAGERKITLAGPGINGNQTYSFNKYIIKWLESRQYAGHDYPCGVDLVFVTSEGKIMALPRLVKQINGIYRGVE